MNKNKNRDGKGLIIDKVADRCRNEGGIKLGISLNLL
jgi:hypothetical protein